MTICPGILLLNSYLEMKLSWCVLFSKLGLNGWSPVMTSNLAQRRSGSTIFFRYSDRIVLFLQNFAIPCAIAIVV